MSDASKSSASSISTALKPVSICILTAAAGVVSTQGKSVFTSSGALPKRTPVPDAFPFRSAWRSATASVAKLPLALASRIFRSSRTAISFLSSSAWASSSFERACNVSVKSSPVNPTRAGEEDTTFLISAARSPFRNESRSSPVSALPFKTASVSAPSPDSSASFFCAFHLDHAGS